MAAGSARLFKRVVPPVATVCFGGAACTFGIRRRFEEGGAADDCSLLDASVVLAKRLLEGKHFHAGLGSKLEDVMSAVARMKQTAPKHVEVEWCCGWHRRKSKLSGQAYWVRRGSFDSPIAELLSEHASRATLWEVRGSLPSEEVNDNESGVADSELLLPSRTVWLGVEPVDLAVDRVVSWLNTPLPRRKTSYDGEGHAVVILPDFGGEFCKRTLPLAELVAAELPKARVMLLEMPHRGTRKGPGCPQSVKVALSLKKPERCWTM
eukprot:TRINITY_DN15738_c0_g1_i1.p1 TRINITY_DN15738_c0_g1~~TRINITY_DN15738_c0_g1_i1.p1  ORF type:complete len:274 (-),score=45.90 TRINITY_DN15738_c0_g1_i1:426-1220(-)